MIKVKTTNNTLVDIADVYVKTGTNVLTKIKEGYQVVEENGVRVLTPIYTSECSHNYVAIESHDPTCTEDGYTIYQCTKCGDTYTESGEPAHGHSYEYVSHQAAGYHEWHCTECGESGTDSCWDYENGFCICGTDLSMIHQDGADMCYDTSYVPNAGGTHTVYCECGRKLRTENCDADVEENGYTYCSKCGQEVV